MPVASELGVLTQVGLAFGRKLAVLVLPIDAPNSGGLGELGVRARWARGTLVRAGWDVYLVAPDATLGEEWQRRNPRRLRATALSSS